MKKEILKEAAQLLITFFKQTLPVYVSYESFWYDNGKKQKVGYDVIFTKNEDPSNYQYFRFSLLWFDADKKLKNDAVVLNLIRDDVQTIPFIQNFNTYLKTLSEDYLKEFIKDEDRDIKSHMFWVNEILKILSKLNLKDFKIIQKASVFDL